LSPRRASWLSLALILLLPLAACGGDGNGDGDDRAEEKKSQPVDGTFVGKVRGTEAFVAVVAAPPSKGEDSRGVTVYVCDGTRICEWFTGTSSGNSFTAASDDDDAKVKGELTRDAASGTVDLPGDKTARYEAGEATAASGLYDLSVSASGKLSGASAAGVALTGKSSLPEPGSGTLKLADGTRLKVKFTTGSAAAPEGLEAGQVRLIVLPEGELRGAGKTRKGEKASGSAFYIRSSSS
jgi:hypothetical protein